jgi:hypothetical protein
MKSTALVQKYKLQVQSLEREAEKLKNLLSVKKTNVATQTSQIGSVYQDIA